MRIKVLRTDCFPPAFEFWTTAKAVNDEVKGAKIQISLNVCAQKCGSKQIHNLAPFSTSLPSSAEECQNFKISLPHFEIENVSMIDLKTLSLKKNDIKQFHKCPQNDKHNLVHCYSKREKVKINSLFYKV